MEWKCKKGKLIANTQMHVTYPFLKMSLLS